MLHRPLNAALLLTLLALPASAAPASQPSDDAWPLYARAIEHVAQGNEADISSPAASPLMFAEYPPYPPTWHRLENESYIFNAPARAWVRALEELTAYLPAAPRDAWGPMGYVLLKPEKPGAAERPLVYSHCNSKDGLFYSTSEPQYSWDPGIGTGDTRKQGGQFRDVTLWAPAHPDPAPTTQPLR